MLIPPEDSVFSNKIYHYHLTLSIFYFVMFNIIIVRFDNGGVRPRRAETAASDWQQEAGLGMYQGVGRLERLFVIRSQEGYIAELQEDTN
jgi:hypothetical protein